MFKGTFQKAIIDDTAFSQTLKWMHVPHYWFLMERVSCSSLFPTNLKWREPWQSCCIEMVHSHLEQSPGGLQQHRSSRQMQQENTVPVFATHSVSKFSFVSVWFHMSQSSLGSISCVSVSQLNFTSVKFHAFQSSFGLVSHVSVWSHDCIISVHFVCFEIVIQGKKQNGLNLPRKNFYLHVIQFSHFVICHFVVDGTLLQMISESKFQNNFNSKHWNKLKWNCKALHEIANHSKWNCVNGLSHAFHHLAIQFENWSLILGALNVHFWLCCTWPCFHHHFTAFCTYLPLEMLCDWLQQDLHICEKHGNRMMQHSPIAMHCSFHECLLKWLSLCSEDAKQAQFRHRR